MAALILKRLTKQQNAKYVGLKDELVRVSGYGIAIHDGINPGGQLILPRHFARGRNLLRNGDFIVQQNGNQWLDAPSVGDYQYIVDGWFLQRGGSSKANVALSEADLAGSEALQRALNITTFSGGGSDDFILISQRIAGVGLLSGKKWCISFEAKCNQAKNIAVEIGNDFKSQTQNQRLLLGRASLTTDYQRFSLIGEFPRLPDTYVRGVNHHAWLYIWLEAGTNLNGRTGGIEGGNFTFKIGDIQLEELEDGDEATPFERMEYQDSRRKVRQYFEKVTSVISLNKSGNNLSDAKVSGYIPFLETKRAAPTVSPTYDFLSGATTFGTSEGGFNVLATSNSDTSLARVLGYTADAEITP
ncbi:hypothetical protein [Shewanella algae]|uniref:hypothetical protein n=1 Tax=Shewanella algae TaxID=38313 RepID=UPI001AAEF437|nr:hypothetical protein [Shewanella algae]MBO2695818.1 hypothetical protein [Shewanella algae]